MNETNAGEGMEQLLSLEEKIHQTIDHLRVLRGEKEELFRDNARLRRELEEQQQLRSALEERLSRLEKERETVRSRVQRLLEQVDSLTNAKLEA